MFQDVKSFKKHYNLLSISWLHFQLTNCSGDQKFKKHYFQLLISWKTPWSWDQIIVATFDLLKSDKIIQSPDQKYFLSPVLFPWSKKLSISWNSTSWTPLNYNKTCILFISTTFQCWKYSLELVQLMSQGELLEMHLLESRHFFSKSGLLDRKIWTARIRFNLIRAVK